MVVIVGMDSWRACWLTWMAKSDSTSRSEVLNVCQAQSPPKVEALIAGRVNTIWPVWAKVSTDLMSLFDVENC